MNAPGRIDTTFDFRLDTPGYPKKDPDVHSPTLRRYHRRLWSKVLPIGERFDLDETSQYYLHHKSDALGEFFLASDAVVPTFRKEAKLAPVMAESPAGELEEFLRLGYTIGGMMVFPAERIGRKMTINGARGFHPRIKDRFDLTVECIRRHYCREKSPLAEVIGRYGRFFDLFRDFHGYVDFFLLQDLVSTDYRSVRFFAPFDDFKSTPVPGTRDSYGSYRRLAMEFLEARNARIAAEGA
jgi:hypothetical protein